MFSVFPTVKVIYSLGISLGVELNVWSASLAIVIRHDKLTQLEKT